MDGFAGRRFQPCLPLGAAHSSLGASGPCAARQRDMSVYVGLCHERRCPVFLPTFLRRTCLVTAPRPAVWVQPEAPQAPVPRRSADTRLARTCRGIHTAMGSSRREGTGSTTEGHHAGLGRRTWRGEREPKDTDRGHAFRGQIRGDVRKYYSHREKNRPVWRVSNSRTRGSL